MQEEAGALGSQAAAERALHAALVQAAAVAPWAAITRNLGHCAASGGRETVCSCQSHIDNWRQSKYQKILPTLTMLFARAHQRPRSQCGRLCTRCGRGGVGVPDRALVHRRDLRNGAGDCGAGLRADGLRLRERRCTEGSQSFMPSTASEQRMLGHHLLPARAPRAAVTFARQASELMAIAMIAAASGCSNILWTVLSQVSCPLRGMQLATPSCKCCNPPL